MINSTIEIFTIVIKMKRVKGKRKGINRKQFLYKVDCEEFGTPK